MYIIYNNDGKSSKHPLFTFLHCFIVKTNQSLLFKIWDPSSPFMLWTMFSNFQHLPLKFSQEILNCFAVYFLQLFILHFCHLNQESLTTTKNSSIIPDKGFGRNAIYVLQIPGESRTNQDFMHLTDNLAEELKLLNYPSCLSSQDYTLLKSPLRLPFI